MRGISRGGLSVLGGGLLLLGAVTGCGGSGPPTDASATRSGGPSPTGTVHIAGKGIGSYSLPRGPDLLVSRERHPRGGTQLHLYVEQTGVELTAGGGALVPFVATDTPATLHVATGCAPGVVIVRTATLTSPARWTVREARYRVTKSGATAAGGRILARRLSPRELSRDYPDIVHGSLLAGCTQ